MRKYRYTIFDTKTNEIIIKDAEYCEVVKALHVEGKNDISADTLLEYSNNGFKYRKRYLATKGDLALAEQHCDRDMINRWNRMMDAADMIRKGGRIVTKVINGEVKRYTVAKS